MDSITFVDCRNVPVIDCITLIERLDSVHDDAVYGMELDDRRRWYDDVETCMRRDFYAEWKA